MAQKTASNKALFELLPKQERIDWWRDDPAFLDSVGGANGRRDIDENMRAYIARFDGKTFFEIEKIPISENNAVIYELPKT